MNVSVGPRWEQFVDTLVGAGRYGSASEIVREGLRLVEEREARLQALRETLHASISAGGSHDTAAVRSAVGESLDSWDRAKTR